MMLPIFKQTTVWGFATLLMLNSFHLLGQNSAKLIDKETTLAEAKAQKKLEQDPGYEKFQNLYPNKQTEAEGSYLNGLEHGKWTFYYENGVVKQVANYLIGKYEGQLTYYYPNGKKKDDGFFHLDKRERNYVSYYSNGNISIQGNFVKDAREGKWISYFENGQKNWEGSYKNGKKDSIFHYQYISGNKFKQVFHQQDNDSLLAAWDQNGKQTVRAGAGTLMEFYMGGEPKSETTYSKGKKESISQSWYKNGSKWIVSHHQKGVLNGPYLLYFNNEQIQDSTNYRDGKEDGEFFQFNADGLKLCHGFFHLGIEDSSWSWYQEGYKIIDGQFNMGKRTNKWIYYFLKSKNIEHYAHYIDDLKSKEWTYFYQGGQVLKTVNFDQNLRNGPYAVFFPDGKKSKVGQFSRDKEDAHWTEWYDNGTVKTQGDFDKGLMDGQWMGYYRSGVQEYTTHYKKSLKNGPFVQYYKNGKEGIKGTYKNDEKVDEWTDWHDKGATIRQKGSYKLISKKQAVRKGVLGKVRETVKNQISIKDGLWYTYFDGQADALSLITPYVNGKIDGKMIQYYSSGKIKSTTKFSKGVKQGKMKVYGKNGDLIKTINFKNNQQQ